MRVLVYGDSNAWGYIADGLGVRLDDRWPVVFAQEAGVDLIEDALPGRTTVHDDPEMAEGASIGADWNGQKHLATSLMAASPLDLVLISLGTNDMKARFSPSAAKIAAGITDLVRLAASIPAGPGGWHELAPPRIGVVCPAPLGKLADDPGWDRVEEWIGGRAASIGLPAELSSRLEPFEVPLFEAGCAAESSPRDPIHFEADQHPKLGIAVAAWYSSLSSRV